MSKNNGAKVYTVYTHCYHPNGAHVRKRVEQGMDQLLLEQHLYFRSVPINIILDHYTNCNA